MVEEPPEPAIFADEINISQLWSRVVHMFQRPSPVPSPAQSGPFQDSINVAVLVAMPSLTRSAHRHTHAAAADHGDTRSIEYNDDEWKTRVLGEDGSFMVGVTHVPWGQGGMDSSK